MDNLSNAAFVDLIRARGYFVWFLAYLAQVSSFALIYFRLLDIFGLELVRSVLAVQFGLFSLDPGNWALVDLWVYLHFAIATVLHLSFLVIVIIKLIAPQPGLVASTRLSFETETGVCQFTLRNLRKQVVGNLSVQLILLRDPQGVGSASSPATPQDWQVIPLQPPAPTIPLLMPDSLVSLSSWPRSEDSETRCLDLLNLAVNEQVMLIATGVRLPSGQPLVYTRIFRREHIVIHQPAKSTYIV